MRDGMRLIFNGISDSEAHFLVLRFLLRSQETVSREGGHPAIAAELQRRAAVASTPKPIRTTRCGAVVAVLECTHIKGMDASKVPLEDRTIELALEEPVEIGRNQQAGFFEQLLQKEPSWLSFVSRSHCRVTLRRTKSPWEGGGSSVASSGRVPLTLKVENLSVNIVFVGDRRLCKDASDVIDEDGGLSFVAAPSGSEEVKFLEFRLRRLRSHGASGA